MPVTYLKGSHTGYSYILYKVPTKSSVHKSGSQLAGFSCLILKVILNVILSEHIIFFFQWLCLLALCCAMTKKDKMPTSRISAMQSFLWFQCASKVLIEGSACSMIQSLKRTRSTRKYLLSQICFSKQTESPLTAWRHSLAYFRVNIRLIRNH